MANANTGGRYHDYNLSLVNSVARIGRRLANCLSVSDFDYDVIVNIQTALSDPEPASRALLADSGEVV